jgi:hypothetical protein
MRYKIKFIFVFCFILIKYAPIKAQFVPCEKQYTVHFNTLLQKIKQIEDFNGHITLGYNAKVLPMMGTSFAPNGQELVKHSGKIYIFLAQTGFIFKMEEPVGDSVIFRKIDNTININYNIDCTNFIYKDQIFNYGGYGFWTKTAHFRKFNAVDQEWDIIPTNIEVFTADYDWFSPTEGKLYVPFQKFENKGLKDPVQNNGIYEYSSYYLDVKTAEWTKIGQLSKELIKLIGSRNNSVKYGYENGRVIMLNDEVFLFDFIHNKVYKSIRADLNQFFIRNSQDMSIFYHKGQFYKYQSSKQNFKTWKLNMNDFQLLDFPIWGTDYHFLIILFIIVLTALAIILFAWLFNRSVRKKIEKAQLKALKSKSLNQAFTEIEIGLIQLLINAYESKQNVEIGEINHVLGIKDKNIGLQKKVRSDVMNSINDKYMLLTQSETNLIGSVRKEDDKRFFEYFITNSEVKTVQKMIEKN